MEASTSRAATLELKQLNPKAYIDTFLSEHVRPDGRDFTDWRQTSINTGEPVSDGLSWWLPRSVFLFCWVADLSRLQDLCPRQTAARWCGWETLPCSAASLAKSPNLI